MQDLYSEDYESQKMVLIMRNARLEDVARFLVNGDISYEDALYWCCENGISEQMLKRWLFVLRHEPAREGPPEGLHVFNFPVEKKHLLYRLVEFLNRLIDEIAELIEVFA